jgi:hypothetical protein
VQSKLKQKETLFAWGNPKWWAWFTGNRQHPSVKSLIRYITQHDGFIVYHGCRPAEIEPYYRRGLRPSDLQQLNELARQRFLTKEFPEITEAAFDSAVALASNSATMARDDGKIFVAIDDRELIRHCGHYLIYGSEHVCGIAAKLCREYGRDYQQVLKRYGTPTVFRISLPMCDVAHREVQSLAECLHKVIWESRKQRTPPRFDWTFTLNVPIPPEQVLGHYHPIEIPDPLHHDIPYRYDE